MSGQTIRGAVATRDAGPQAIIAQYQADFARVLPTHVKPEHFVRLAQGVLRRNEKVRKVAEQNPGSFLAALLDCARLGHEPDTPAYYLVPFGSEVEGIEGYRGKVERIYNAGAVASVKADVVREADTFVWDPETMDKPKHKADWFGDRGDLKGVYAYGVFRDGSVSRVVVMGRREVMLHKAESKSSGRADSPWNKWEQSMWLKTAVHELEKWVPSSAERWVAQTRAMAAQPGEQQPPAATSTPEIVDAELVDEMPLPQPNVEPPPVDNSVDQAEDSSAEELPTHVDVPPPPTTPKPTMKAKLADIDETFTSIGWTITADQLRAASIIAGRDVTALGNLSHGEADALLTALSDCAADKDPQGRLADLIAEIREGAS